MPPIAPGRWPWVGSAPALLRRPTEYLRRARVARRHVRGGGIRLPTVLRVLGRGRAPPLCAARARGELRPRHVHARVQAQDPARARDRAAPPPPRSVRQPGGRGLPRESRASGRPRARGARLRGDVRGVHVGAPARASARPRLLCGGRGRLAASPRSARTAARPARHLGLVRAPVARAVRHRHRQADRAARDARHRGGDWRDPRRARAHGGASGRLPAADLGRVGGRTGRRARRAGRARRDDHPHGRAVEPLRRARVDARQRAAAPRAARAHRGGRRRAARALRERIDPHGAELAHAAPGAAPGRDPRRRARLSAPARHVPRDDALAEQLQRRTGPRRLRPRSLRGPAPVGQRAARGARAREHVRPRPALVPRAALLDLGDPRRAAAPGRAPSAHAALRARRAATAPARRGRARGAAVRFRTVRASPVGTLGGAPRSRGRPGRARAAPRLRAPAPRARCR